MRIQVKYALLGIAFGAFFPAGAAVFEIIIHNHSFTIASLKLIHTQNPLLYIIDSAPLWLGIFALFGGIQQAKSSNLLNQFEQISKILSQSCNQLNIDSKDTYSQMKKELNQLINGSNQMKTINEDINNNINSCKTHSTEMSDSAKNMINSINNLFVYNEKANKGNEEITSTFLIFLTKIDEIETYFEQVKSIGKQINILALNSGIEASKIGDRGKGFSVIAKNIKDLAERTFTISNSIDKLLKISKDEVSTIKTKIDDEQKNLISLSKISKNLESEMNSFQSSADYIFSIIKDTYSKNDEQNTIFEELKSTIEYIETAYSTMYKSLSETIEEETKVVKQISRLKQKSSNKKPHNKMLQGKKNLLL